jgi:tRNA dimethylallyltransferase
MTGLIVICGATATGKSGLAIALAQRLQSIILSADSRQVYREFDIGTAKPTAAQQQIVPHYLIDICDPTETLTVAEYQQQAQVLIAKETRGQSDKGIKGQRDKGTKGQRDKGDKVTHSPPSLTHSLTHSLPLLVGGTGLYIKSIVRGMKIPRVAPQPELRSQLASLGQRQLYTMLQQVDAIAAQKIHSNDAVRTLRALEVFYVTGRSISEQQGENPPTYPILQIGLDSDSAVLKRRIEQRTEEMLATGWEEEVKALCQKYGSDLPLLDTLGYQEMKQYLQGDLTLTEAKELIVLHTRQFAKRQRTWFHAYPEIQWFDADRLDRLDRVWQLVQEFTCGGY